MSNLSHSTSSSSLHICPSAAFQDPSSLVTEEFDSGYVLSRIMAGDETAMGLFYDHYSKYVYSSALRILRDVSLAEDIVQEVFIMIWRRPEVLRGNYSTYKGWMLTVGRNRAVDVIRSQKRCNALPMEDVVLASPHDYASLAEDGVMTERASMIIAELPEETRTLIEMAFFQGMTHLEISEQTGVPLGTVKSKIRNGLLSVRKTFAMPGRIAAA